MVWEYFETLRRAVARSRAEQDPNKQRQEISIAVFLAVTTVETFLNMFFRVLADEGGYRQHRQRLLEDIQNRRSLEYKWMHWPKLFFGRAVDEAGGQGRQFQELKDLRNRLMHFTSTHETKVLPGNTIIMGLAETSAFDDLKATDAERALSAAEGAITVVLEAKGVPESEISGVVHHWTGKIPV
jgi:hypothetical protein